MASTDTGVVVHVYAQALWEAAHEAGEAGRVEEEVRLLGALVRREARFLLFLETPTVAFEDKRKVLENVFRDYSPLIRNFLLVLTRNRRVPMLEQAVAAFHEYSNKKKGIVEFQLESARKFEPAERDRLARVLREKLGQEVVIQEAVRPALLGGFILARGDRRWNASLAHRLARLMARLKAVQGELGVWVE